MTNEEFFDDQLNQLAVADRKREELLKIVQMMEAMANAPREELGKRQPGEKCSYEK